MNSDFTEILGVQVSTLDEKDILEYVRKYLGKGVSRAFLRIGSRQWGVEKKDSPLVIFTPNPEIVVYAQKDEKFKQLVKTAQINLCDGRGLVWAGQLLAKPRLKRIPGADFSEKLVELAAKLGVGIGLIGGKPGVALEALKCLKKKYPGLKGWAEEGPAVEDNNYNFYNLYKKIQETKTGIILAGMGCPKQEYFMERILKQVQDDLNFKEPLVLMAVGGTLDYWAGRVKRAPVIVQKLGLEWLWRLILQPWRFKRQLSLLKFIFLVYKARLDNSRFLV